MDKNQVMKLGTLAHMTIEEHEAENLLGDLSAILGYVSEIGNSGVSPHEKTAGEHRNIMREDSAPHESGVHTEDLLEEAPLREGDFVKVKKIL